MGTEGLELPSQRVVPQERIDNGQRGNAYYCRVLARPLSLTNFSLALSASSGFRPTEYIDEFFKTDVETESSKRWKEQKTKKKRKLPKDAFVQLRLQRSHPWVLAGDLNETPSDSAVADLVSAFDGQEHGVMRHRKMRRQIARLYDLAQCADKVSTDTAALSRWLKAKADPAAESLLDETGRHAETAAQAADSIARYWQAFWRDLDIQRPAFHVRNAAVMEGVEVPQQEAVLPLPTGEELGARARKATGAGGADGWHSSELRHLPDGAFELFADLIRGWANEGRVPLQMQQSRMVCIPKPGRRVDNSSVGVGDVRPITITSCWWRLFAGTFYNSVQFKQWRRENLSEEIGAITGEDCYLTLAGIMHEFAERKHLLAMDFTKAFDTLDVEVSLQILRRMRWSPGIMALLGSAWGNQQRFVQWPPARASPDRAERLQHSHPSVGCYFGSGGYGGVGRHFLSGYLDRSGSSRSNPQGGGYLRQEHGVMRHRKMPRQIARLYDLAQCAGKVAEGTASSQMVLNLQALRQRCGNLTAGQARAEARTLQNLLHAEEEREKSRRLRDWRTKVSTDTAALSRWLKAKADPAAESLLDETGRHAETAAQAADSIARYWQAFWRDLDIQRPAFHVRNAAVMEGVEVPQQEAVLPLPTGEELGARARKATGAGGADGWHSSELRHLPDGAFELFADLIRGWANEGRVPLQMQQSRMVCIPKPGRRVDNSSVGVGDVRPITITSCWWRLFAGTFYNSVQFKQWRRENLSEEIGAITGEDCYLTLAGIMHEFAERKHLLAMDFTKAFDTLDVEVSLQILRRMRWSPGIMALLGSAWGNQQRFVQWKNHCREEPLQGLGQPQGDPMGPLIMTLWVQAGLRVVRRRMAQAQAVPAQLPYTKVYVDDRTAVSASPAQLVDTWQRWQAWSAEAGLVENNLKTWVTGVTAKQRDRLRQVFPPDRVVRVVQTLGACTYGTPRALTPEELKRGQRARTTLALLSCVGMGLRQFLAAAKVFAMTKANFGSPSATLDAWLVGRGWHRLRPWHWRHADADTELDLRPPARASPDRAERLQHSVRVGVGCYFGSGGYGGVGRHFLSGYLAGGSQPSC
ncbi:unnamed protein product [Effrenium voratum]|nr:unnamed protein product [Effrenium voratum]